MSHVTRSPGPVTRIIVTNVTHWILDGITQNILVPELRGLKLPDIKK